MTHSVTNTNSINLTQPKKTATLEIVHILASKI